MWSIFIFLFFLPMMVTSHKPCSEIFQRIPAPENGTLQAQFEVVIYQADFANEDFTIWKSEITFNNPINITKSNVTVGIRYVKWDNNEFVIESEHLRPEEVTSNKTASLIIKLEKEAVEGSWFSIKFIILLDISYQSTYIDVNQFVLNKTFICKGGNACGINRYSTLLVHYGEKSKVGNWPWLVALHKKGPTDLNFFCAGTLVSTKHVITAAHCLRSEERFHYEFENIFVALGTKTNLDPKTHLIKVSDFIVHQDWGMQRNGKKDGDIAILILEKDVTFSVDIQPACLDFNENVTNFGTVVGWGANENYYITGDISKEVILPIVSNEICNESDGRFSFLTSERTICAGFLNGSGPCSGDSGGGLYTNGTLPGDILRYSLTGIISRSLSENNKKCDLSRYTIYTRISAYKNWIKYIVQSNTNSIINHDFVRQLLFDFSKLQFDYQQCKSSIADQNKISYLEKVINETNKMLERNNINIKLLDTEKQLCNVTLINSQLDHNNTKIKLVQKSLEIEQHLRNQESERANFESNITKFESEKITLESQVQHINSQLQSRNSQILNLETQITDLGNKLNEQLNEYMRNEKNQDEKIEEIQKEKQNLLSKNNDVENKNSGLMNEIKKLSAQVESMKKELEIAKPLLKIRNEEIVEAYRKKLNLEADKKIIMKEACVNGAIEVVRALLDLGYVAVNDRVDDYCTGLFVAAWNNRANVVSLLLDRGADVNLRDTYSDGFTPLMYAAYRGSLESAKLLVTRGADKTLTSTDSSKLTSLRIARDLNQQDMIKYLVSVGVPE